MLLRSARHRAPVIELSLFRARSFAVANAGMFAFSTAFYALLLCNVLFLTQVWGFSILTAGFAVTPGPLTAALTAPIAGRSRTASASAWSPCRARSSSRPAARCSRPASARRRPTRPSTWSRRCSPAPASGFSFAAWGSAAVAELPPARFATGSAVLACVRQIGAVLGIAALVAMLDAAEDPMAGFVDAWTMMAVTGGVVAALALALGRVRVV